MISTNTHTRRPLQGVARRALRLLISHCKDPSTRSLLGKYNLPEAVSLALRTHSTSEGVCHFGISVLGNLAFSNPDNRARISQICLDDVLRSMSSYRSNADLQCHGMLALTNLAHENDPNKRLISSRGGVSTVLDAMESHLGEEKVQRQACWALLTISADTVAAQRAAADGAVGAVGAAMVNFVSSPDVQQFGLWALSNVAYGSDALAKFVAKNGAPEVAQRAVYAHGEVREVVEKAEVLMKRIGPFIPRPAEGVAGKVGT